MHCFWGFWASEVEAAYSSVLSKLGGGIPPSLKLADALGAAHQLKLIAMNRASIYNVLPAISALHMALHNPNSKVVLAAARVLGQTRDPMAQRMLVRAALHSSGATSAVRAALFQSVATSARNLGDKLTKGQIHGLIRVAMTSGSADVKLAAAQALGALNIPSNRASTLILGMQN